MFVQPGEYSLAFCKLIAPLSGSHSIQFNRYFESSKADSPQPISYMEVTIVRAGNKKRYDRIHCLLRQSIRFGTCPWWPPLQQSMRRQRYVSRLPFDEELGLLRWEGIRSWCILGSKRETAVWTCIVTKRPLELATSKSLKKSSSLTRGLKFWHSSFLRRCVESVFTQLWVLALEMIT